jgi:hypothetical protein
MQPEDLRIRTLIPTPYNEPRYYLIAAQVNVIEPCFGNTKGALLIAEGISSDLEGRESAMALARTFWASLTACLSRLGIVFACYFSLLPYSYSKQVIYSEILDYGVVARRCLSFGWSGWSRQGFTQIVITLGSLGGRKSNSSML